MADIKITNDDNMELMARYEDNYFDLAIVDPPYGLGMGKNLNVNVKVNYQDKKWDQKIPNKEYFKELFRVSSQQIIWGGNYFPFLWINGCKGFICWNKLISEKKYNKRADVELAWTSFNITSRYFEYKWDGNIYGFKNNIKGIGEKSIRIHPTQKPVALYEWLLINYAKEGDKILDTHLGSGSIAIACHNLGFDLTACELDKDYYKAAIKRLKEHQTQIRMF